MTQVASNRPTNSIVRQSYGTGYLSRRARRMVLLFIAIGLLTFFLPLISFDPPALGKEHWSILDIVLVLQAGMRPGMPFPFLRIPFALTYLLLLLAMATVCLMPFRKLLLGITALGLYLLYPFRGLFGALTLAAFFLPLGKGGDVRPLWLVLVIVMLVVALTAWSNAAD